MAISNKISFYEFYNMVSGKHHVIYNSMDTLQGVIKFSKIYQVFFKDFFKDSSDTIMFCPEMIYQIYWPETNRMNFPRFNTEGIQSLIEEQDKIITTLQGTNVILTYSKSVLEYLKTQSFKGIDITDIDLTGYTITYKEV